MGSGRLRGRRTLCFLVAICLRQKHGCHCWGDTRACPRSFVKLANSGQAVSSYVRGNRGQRGFPEIFMEGVNRRMNVQLSAWARRSLRGPACRGKGGCNSATTSCWPTRLFLTVGKTLDVGDGEGQNARPWARSRGPNHEATSGLQLSPFYPSPAAQAWGKAARPGWQGFVFL